MGVKVTLTIPDDVYGRAQQIAQTEQRPVAEIFSDALAQIFPATYISPDRPKMLQEENAFRHLYPELLVRYLGEFVAIYHGEVVDHDRDRLRLLERIDEKYPNEVVLIRQVIEESAPVLHIRSPRWVQ